MTAIALQDYIAELPRPLPGFRRYQPRAGHPDWPRLDAEARALAAELLPRLERPEPRGAALRRRLASYRTAAGNFVENRRRTRAGREDLVPLYFIWTMLRACNFRCTYCDDHQGRKYPDLPAKGALDTARGKRLLEVMRTRAPSVYFAGGEPTARQDLPALTRAARDLKYFPILINTNGSLVARQLARPEWRTWLADTDVVIVSLDGLDLARLGRLWVTDAPQTVLRNLLLLRELSAPMRFKLMVNCVVEPGQIAEAQAVLDLANDLGIWFAPVPMNVGPRIAGGLRDDPAYEAFCRNVIARKREGHRIVGSERLTTRLLGSAPLDCRNTLKPHVDFDGRLAWPCKATVNVSPEYVDVLEFDDVDALYAHACSRVEPTRFHGPASNQCGADCNWAQNYTTDAYAHGLRKPWTLVREVLDLVRSS
ncbi:MAG: radical additional 4Fe4S-binding domain protein [Myxococcaceae bacterium]|nr:radical additional 4Fe4S-binding domain protein [Myxococcaceae bacterium]